MVHFHLGYLIDNLFKISLKISQYFPPRNSTSFFLPPNPENGNSIHQLLKKEGHPSWVTSISLPFFHLYLAIITIYPYEISIETMYSLGHNDFSPTLQQYLLKNLLSVLALHLSINYEIKATVAILF